MCIRDSDNIGPRKGLIGLFNDVVKIGGRGNEQRHHGKRRIAQIAAQLANRVRMRRTDLTTA